MASKQNGDSNQDLHAFGSSKRTWCDEASKSRQGSDGEGAERALVADQNVVLMGEMKELSTQNATLMDLMKTLLARQ